MPGLIALLAIAYRKRVDLISCALRCLADGMQIVIGAGGGDEGAMAPIGFRDVLEQSGGADAAFLLRFDDGEEGFEGASELRFPLLQTADQLAGGGGTLVGEVFAKPLRLSGGLHGFGNGYWRGRCSFGVQLGVDAGEQIALDVEIADATGCLSKRVQPAREPGGGLPEERRPFPAPTLCSVVELHEERDLGFHLAGLATESVDCLLGGSGEADGDGSFKGDGVFAEAVHRMGAGRHACSMRAAGPQAG